MPCNFSLKSCTSDQALCSLGFEIPCRIRHCNRSCEIVGGSHIFMKVIRRFRRQCGICFVKVFRKPLAAFWIYLIRDCHLLFHKNNYSDKFIDTNYYKQNKQNDNFELYVTKDCFYKAYGTLPTKTPTNFEQYVTAA